MHSLLSKHSGKDMRNKLINRTCSISSVLVCSALDALGVDLAVLVGTSSTFINLGVALADLADLLVASLTLADFEAGENTSMSMFEDFLDFAGLDLGVFGCSTGMGSSVRTLFADLGVFGSSAGVGPSFSTLPDLADFDLGVFGSSAGVGSSVRPFLALAVLGVLGSSVGIGSSLSTLRGLADFGVVGSFVRAGSSNSIGSSSTSGS